MANESQTLFLAVPIELEGLANAPALSAASQARLYYNPAVGLMLSLNGGAYTAIAGGGGGLPSGPAGGALSGTYPNPALANVGPGATGPIGDATHAPVITINAKGQVTALTSQAISGVPPSAHAASHGNGQSDAVTLALAQISDAGTAAALAADADGTMAADSDSRLATQKATVTYVAAQIAAAVTGLLDFKGAIDCSANPNYPAASKGDAYVVSVAGKIGGAAGLAVDIGDAIVASADNAGGTQAAVGSSWFILEHNLSGVLLSSDIGVTVQAFSAVLSALASVMSSTATAAAQRTAIGADPYDIAFSIEAAPTASQVLLRFVADRAITLPASLTGSRGKAGVAATAQTDIDLQKNGVSAGTVRFAAAGTVPSFIAAAPIALAAGDVLTAIAPGTPDATLAQFGVTLAGSF